MLAHKSKVFDQMMAPENKLSEHYRYQISCHSIFVQIFQPKLQNYKSVRIIMCQDQSVQSAHTI